MTNDTHTKTKDELLAQLQDLVQEAPDYPDDESLRQQNDTLNLIFKRLLSDAERKYNPLPQYSLALRAQSQYIRTMQIARQIELEESEDI